jgi:hypothetical protein
MSDQPQSQPPNEPDPYPPQEQSQGAVPSEQPPADVPEQPDPASLQPVHLAGGPDVADHIANNPHLIHRSAAHWTALNTAPEARTPEQQIQAQQLGEATEAIPEAERTPHHHHLLDLWHKEHPPQAAQQPAEPAPAEEPAPPPAWQHPDEPQPAQEA